MIRVHDLHKSFGPKTVLKGVSFEIHPGETLTVIGKSGTGKSVLLKLIVGLLEPDQGWVEIEGKRVDQMNRSELYEMRRKIGYVFQGAALFDSLTVAENLTLGLYEHGQHDRKVLDNEARDRLADVGLLPLPSKVSNEEYETSWNVIAGKMPSELSGGMRKRVGVARALVGAPQYVFYDEPTTGLDPVTSEQIDNLVKDLAGRLDVTSVVITHDLFSVYKVADRVIMLHEGLRHFEGSPEELRGSKDPIVREFIDRYEASEAKRD